jgi:hypothetical protein
MACDACTSVTEEGVRELWKWRNQSFMLGRWKVYSSVMLCCLCRPHDEHLVGDIFYCEKQVVVAASLQTGRDVVPARLHWLLQQNGVNIVACCPSLGP